MFFFISYIFKDGNSIFVYKGILWLFFYWIERVIKGARFELTQFSIAVVNQKLIKFRNKHHLDVDIDFVRQYGKRTCESFYTTFCSLSVRQTMKILNSLYERNLREAFRISSLTFFNHKFIVPYWKLWVKVNKSL